jgi:uncharacterized protein YkwD
MRVLRAGLVILLLCGCGPRSRRGPATELAKPTGPLNLKQAREYVLGLVNRDRADLGLETVEHDEPAERAGQGHAEDMVRHGYTAHWGSDGSVPEQRYTEAGGEHFVQENAGCFFDAQTRELDQNPMFDAAELEKVQTAFMSEKPPHDGHRQNIIKPVHNRFGVGLAKAVGLSNVCMSQEFVDAYGEYGELPREAKAGQKLEIEGEVHDPVGFGGVGIGRIEPAKPKSAEELNNTSTYRVPQPDELYHPAGFKTPKPVTLQGRHFSIELAVRGPGRCEVSIWGKYPGAGDELVMISLRTIRVR